MQRGGQEVSNFSLITELSLMDQRMDNCQFDIITV